ncbi:germinal-center associated nuclear protein [Lingula anatina]|uniref:Germinal-center associated nuclear protein n=1 Tax=Lingula anatina TaxID=7574 RepID=A0A1S3K0A9_LINAN|nr:germinal-center associated nuclear protein [Lingula anatina]|eukprot:XP_013415982.1 germinal-center associated nuclear protein [Lingula anatina]
MFGGNNGNSGKQPATFGQPSFGRAPGLFGQPTASPAANTFGSFKGSAPSMLPGSGSSGFASVFGSGSANTGFGGAETSVFSSSSTHTFSSAGGSGFSGGFGLAAGPSGTGITGSSSATSLCGNPSGTSISGSPNAFGLTGSSSATSITGSSSAGSSTGSSRGNSGFAGGFGQGPSHNVFGGSVGQGFNTGQGRPGFGAVTTQSSAFSGSNLFSKGGTDAKFGGQSGSFGSGTSDSSLFSSGPIGSSIEKPKTADLFGQTSSGSGVFGGSSKSGFESKPASSNTAAGIGNIPKSVRFGRDEAPAKTAANIFASNSPSSSSSLFSQNISGPFTSSTTSGNAGVFGTASGNVFGGAAQKNVFGEKGEQSVSTTTSAGLFGGQSNMSTKTSAGAGKALYRKGQSLDVPDTDPRTSMLFGKLVKPAPSTTEPSTMGKQGARVVDVLEEKSTMVGESKKVLFGKRESENTEDMGQSKRALFGSSEMGDSDDNKQGKRKLIRRPLVSSARGAASGLFGKALSAVRGTAVKKSPSSDIKTWQTASVEGQPVDQEEGEIVEEKASGAAAAAAGKIVSSRRRSSDDTGDKVAIVCKNVPKIFNKREALRGHFQKYGPVSKVFVNPNRNQATIHFKNHEGAALAKRKGKYLRKDLEPLQIFWSSYSPQNIAKTSVLKKKAMPTSHSELDDELAAMQGTQDVQGHSVKTLARPDERKADVILSRDGKSRLGGFVARSRSPAPTEVNRDRSRSPVKEQPVAGASRSRSRSPAPISSGQAVTQKVPPKLKSLVNAVGQTAAERFEILDTRDKLLRQGKSKQQDITKVKAVVGVCPDMCPERERYMREDRRRLHHFEIMLGSESNPRADHARCIKEYSRSSADQDEPLPHELRPAPVLAKTMDYMVNNIMDRGGDGKWADWYEFVWSRTRGIRKDITQQHLCNETAVSLLEKCTRYHIYCSERLCEEGPAVFDEKINNENLTKCLQSLKELYHDLATKQNIYCPKEAEFRAYMVLMNLNEGDILREVQQLRDEVRHSKEIKFVLKVYNALNSNNYIKFFKLTHQATFLNACIMHRYFNQVRQKALLIMLRAYKGGPTVTNFPVNEMQRLLCFENATDTRDFCEFYGLHTDGDYIHLDKNAFIRPETSMGNRRAVELIESKQTVSVGEVVNGEKLPPNELIIPFSSFDDRGHYRGEMVQGFTEPEPSSEEQSTPEEPPPPYEASPVPSPLKFDKYPGEAVKGIAKELFLEVIDEMSKDMSRTLVQAAQMYLNSDKDVYGEIEGEVCKDVARSVSQEVYNEAMQKLREEEEQKRREEEERQTALSKERVTKVECDELLEEVVTQECKNMATIEIREIQAKLKEERIQRCTDEISKELVETAALEEILRVSKEVYQTDVIQRLQELDECEKGVKTMRQARFFKCWVNMYMGRMRLKRSMLAFPSAPSNYTSSEQLEQLMPEREEVEMSQDFMPLGKRARLTIRDPTDLVEKNSRLTRSVVLKKFMQRLRHEHAWAPLDIPALIGGNLWKIWDGKFDGPNMYWKVLLSLPECHEEEMKQFNNWLVAKFRRGTLSGCDNLQHRKSTLLSLYSSELDDLHPQSQVSVCARTLEGTLTEDSISDMEEKRLLLGSSAIIFVLGPMQDESRAQEYWLEEQLRLARILQAKPVDPALPLLLVSWRDDLSVDILSRSDMLNLDVFLAQDLISAVEIVNVGDLEDLQSCSVLTSGVQWLSDHCPAPPSLTRQEIREYVEDFMAKEFYVPVYQDLANRKKQGLLHQPPDVLINLYNSVAMHLVQVGSSRTLSQFSWPLPEFAATHHGLPDQSWNTEDTLSLIEDVLSSLTLPEFDPVDWETESWESAVRDVWAYVEAVAESTDADAAALCSRIQRVIYKVEHDYDETCYLNYDLNGCRPCYVNMPWTDIIIACVNHQLTSLDFLDIMSATETEDEQEIVLHYLAEELNDFSPPSEWKQAIRDIRDTTVEANLQDTFSRAAAKRKAEVILNAREEGLHKQSVKEPGELGYTTTYVDLTTMVPEYVAAMDRAHLLQERLAQEKRLSQSYEENLRLLMMEGGKDECQDLDGPLFVHTNPLRNYGSIGSGIIDLTHDDDEVMIDLDFQRSRSSPLSRSFIMMEAEQSKEIFVKSSLSDSFMQFERAMQSSREAERLYEMKLQALANN